MDHERRISVCYSQLNPKYLWKENRIDRDRMDVVPSSVYIFTAKPRGSRTVSAEPFSPAEVGFS